VKNIRSGIELVVLALGALSLSGLGQDFKIAVTSDLVLLDVSVKNSKGGYVGGLPKESFQVFEGGKPQTISQFSHDDIPVTVGLVIDSSGSMGPKYDQVVTAALVFVGSSNPKDETFIVHFNEGASKSLPPDLPFTDDSKKLRDALFSVKPAGQTALYDAMILALDHLEKGTRDKKSLVLVSDGGDNRSTHTLDEVKRRIQESRATIYTIGLFDEDDRDQNPGVLRQLSGLSGGETFLPKETNQVVEICRQVATDIRTRYTVGYVPFRDGSTAARKIKVTATGPNGQKLTAHSRTSYAIPVSGGSR